MTAHIKRLWTTPQGLRVEYFETEDAKMPNDRDTHFAGFAELLASEIETLDNEIVPGTNDMSLSYGHWKERVRQLIAKRAFDLAMHVLKTVPVGAFEREQELAVFDVPDLTEWHDIPDFILLAEAPTPPPDARVEQAPPDDQLL